MRTSPRWRSSSEGQPIFCNLGTGRRVFGEGDHRDGGESDGQESARSPTARAAPGDAIALYADPSRAKQLLGWEAKYKDPETIIRSAWNWFESHPRGYRQTD